MIKEWTYEYVLNIKLPKKYRELFIERVTKIKEPCLSYEGKDLFVTTSCGRGGQHIGVAKSVPLIDYIAGHEVKKEITDIWVSVINEMSAVERAMVGLYEENEEGKVVCQTKSHKP